MKKDIWYLLILILFYLILNAFDQAYIFTDELIYRILSEEYSVSVVDAILASENRFGWIIFVILPFIVLFKILFTTFCVTTGAILTDTDFTFRKIFCSSTVSEYVFLLSQALFSLNLYLNLNDLNIVNAGNYFPLSILSFLGTENVATWLHYPLQTLNFFEVLYVILISWLLSKKWKPDFVESLNIVIPSYGIGLLLWMALVVFLTLQIS